MSDASAAVPFQADGYHTLTPHILAHDASAAIDFYKHVFGATERMLMVQPDGKVGHAELQIGDSVVMLADEFPDMGFVGPKTIGGSGSSLHVYVEDADAVFNKAVAAGATVRKPMQDQFYGDRSGSVEDPFGHVWTIATHVEDVTPEQIKERLESMGGCEPSGEE